MPEYNLKQNLSKLKTKPFNFALFEGKKSKTVLVTSRPAAAKLIEETKEACGEGKRVAKGLCLREDGQIMFATRVKPSPGWKATIKKIFQDQKCSTFLPIDVRQLRDSESEEVVTADEDETLGAVAPESTAIPAAPPIPSALASKPPAAPATKPAAPAGPDAGKAQVDRFTALTRKVLGAGIADPALKNQLFKLFGEAKQLAAAKNFDQLKVCLDQIESHFNSLPVTGAMPGKVQFEKINLDWNSKKRAIGNRLATLHQAIVSEFNDPDGNSAAKKLDRVLARFNEGLSDKLDALRNATTPQGRAQLAAESNSIADRYLQYLDTDPLVAHLETNPFNIDLQIQQTLSGPLNQLKQQLQQLEP